MITAGQQTVVPYYDLNTELFQLEGELSEIKAKETLSKFLIHNAHHFTWEMLTDLKLFPYQSILIKSWLLKNFSMNIISRGGAKSYLLAVFAALYSIINPGARIVICSSGFRRSRAVLEQVDKFLKSEDANLLKQCFPSSLKRRNDEYRIDIGEGFITALPLSSAASLRGQRADIVLFDEGLLCPEEIWNEQIKPFLVAKSGIQEVMKIREIEDFLIKKGLLKEENREFIKTTKKIIVCSSGCYKFEFLYRWFEDWVNIILGKQKIEKGLEGSYFVCQIPYQALPEDLIDMAIINEAKNSSMSDATFEREYNAQFTDDSSGFFRASKMLECTIKPGELPCVEIKADPNAKYIMALDTNLGESLTCDNFAMSLFKLNMEQKNITLTHAYAKAGGSFKQHATYFYYLFTQFKPVLLIADKGAGAWRFFEACNEMMLFKDNKLKIEQFEADFDQDDYNKALREAKMNYNLEGKKIAYLQSFTNQSKSKMNDLLQIWIDKKRVWFASPLSAQENILNEARKIIPDYLFEGQNKERELEDMIDDLDDNISLTKNETTLIEVKSSPNGGRTFELPQHLKRSTSPSRARRDSYTCLFLGCWMAKCYFDMCDQPVEQSSFTPVFVA